MNNFLTVYCYVLHQILQQLLFLVSLEKVFLNIDKAPVCNKYNSIQFYYSHFIKYLHYI